MSRSKKILSLVLTVIMAVTMMTVAPATASAASTVRINEVYPEVGQKILYNLYVQTDSVVAEMKGRLNYDSSVLECDELSYEGLPFGSNDSFDDKETNVSNSTMKRIDFAGTKASYDSKSSRMTVLSAIFTVKATNSEYTPNTSADAVSACFTSLVSKYGEDLMKSENTYITTRTVIAPTKVTMAKTSVLLDRGVGDYETVKVKSVGPVNSDVDSTYLCTYKSSNTKVVKVTSGRSTGVKIVAVGPGTATVTCTADGEQAKTTIKVTVKQPVKKVALNRTSASLAKKGSSVTLKATASPSNSSNKKLYIKSTNTRVATVSASAIYSGKTFKVTAKAKGTAYVQATAADGSRKYARCKIVVRR